MGRRYQEAGVGVGAVLFDMDGVLIHSYQAWFALVNAVAADLGYPAISAAAFHAAWGQGIQEDVATWFTRHRVGDIERAYTAGFRDHLHDVVVDPDAAAVVAELRARRVPVAVITNTPREMAAAILAHAGIVPDVLVGGTDVVAAKPAPDMVLLACARLGVSAPTAWVVGDSRFDRLAARAAGCRFAGLGIDGDINLDGLGDVRGLPIG